MSKLFDLTTRVLSQALYGTSRRHEVISNNLANIDTPNFRPADYRFDQLIRENLAAARGTAASREPIPLELYDPQREFQRMLPRVRLAFEEFTEPGMVIEDSHQIRLDGNSVDIDQQMAKLAQNTVEHHAYVKLLNAKLRLLRTAMEG